jgi:fructose-1,6-bisphosphatase I
MQPEAFLTVQQHVQEEQRRVNPHASGEFSWLLSGITLATKVVAAQIRRAGLVDIIGSTGTTNVQGESVQKLDILANQALISCLGNRGKVGVLASEEDEQPVVTLRDPQYGKYIVVFDPLDGSSNIDVNVSVGTIFSVLRREPDESGAREPQGDVLQPGIKQVAAGYVLYGARGTACTASRSIRSSAPTCSRIPTSRCPRADRTIRSTRPIRPAFRRAISGI